MYLSSYLYRQLLSRCRHKSLTTPSSPHTTFLSVNERTPSTGTPVADSVQRTSTPRRPTVKAKRCWRATIEIRTSVCKAGCPVDRHFKEAVCTRLLLRLWLQRVKQCSDRPNPFSAYVWIAILVISCGIHPASLKAQTSYGSVVGTVTDSAGAVIAGAQVHLTNKGTNAEQAAVTGAGWDLHLHQSQSWAVQHHRHKSGVQVRHKQSG